MGAVIKESIDLSRETCMDLGGRGRGGAGLPLWAA